MPVWPLKAVCGVFVGRRLMLRPIDEIIGGRKGPNSIYAAMWNCARLSLVYTCAHAMQNTGRRDWAYD